MTEKKPYDTPNSKDHEKVILQPIWGIKPTIYIPIFYIVILLLILVLIGYYSLVVRKGSYISITSTPNHAAVYIDNFYIGSTPLRSLQKTGTHSLRVSLPFYEVYEDEFTHTNPLIKLLAITKKNIVLIPQKLILDNHDHLNNPRYDISNVDSKNLVDYTVRQIASWNIANTQTTRNIIPPILDQVLSQLSSLITPDIITNEYISLNNIENIMHITLEILYQVMPYLANSKDMARISKENQTWINYYEKFSQWDLLYTFTEKNQQNQDIVYKKTQLDYFYQDLSNLDLEKSQISFHAMPHNTSIFKVKTVPENSPQILKIRDLNFTKIPSQTLYYKRNTLKDKGDLAPIHNYMEFIPSDDSIIKNINEAPRHYMEIHVPSFYVMNAEITQSEYQKFLDSIGFSIEAWKKQTSNTVAEDYRKYHFGDFGDKSNLNIPLRHITWYDAMSYIAWLNTQLADSPYEARLPNEYYWNAAIQVYPSIGELNKKETYVPSIKNNKRPELIGSLWEWGSSWYSPNPQYSDFEGPLYGSEKHIFGGSYITKESTSIEQTPLYLSRNTAAPPTWANEFIGFRVILVSKELSENR